MPALNFQSRFAALVERGDKRQTIRAKRMNGRDPKPGDTLYLYTGMRQKWCRKLGESDVRMVTPFEIVITPDGGAYWVMAEDVMTIDEMDQLAIADGFGGWGEMSTWFEQTHGLPFSGVMIEWGDLKK